jgi:hypothetical protein
MPTLAQFITWIVMGLLGGSLAGLIITRERNVAMACGRGIGLMSESIFPGCINQDRRLLLINDQISRYAKRI